MNDFAIFSLILVELLIFNKILDFFSLRLKTYHKVNWYKFAFLSRKHLVKLSNGVFENWCVNFLERQGYRDVTIFSVWNDNKYKTITCLSQNEMVYVFCKHTKEITEIEDSYEKLGRPELQKFIGTLEHDNVSKGIVITTGDFTPEANEYAQDLPERITLQLFDGSNLIEEHQKFREKEVSLLLQQEKN